MVRHEWVAVILCRTYMDIHTIDIYLHIFMDDLGWDMSHLTETFWWASGKSKEETWTMMQRKDPLGKENETILQKRLNKLKEYLISFKNDKLVIVLVCHSEVVWWLTNYVNEGQRRGKWTRNGEFVDITQEIVFSNVSSSLKSSNHSFEDYDNVNQLP